MPLTDHKITAFLKKVADLTDVPSENMQPAEIKAWLDSPSEELRVKLNALIDDLGEESAASFIGALDGVTVTTVQNLLDTINSQSTSAESIAGEANTKSDQALTQANIAVADSASAVITSNEAKQQSQSADTKSNVTQAQIDTLVIQNGTSDAEILQSRTDNNGTTFPLLKDRLANVDSQLAEKVKKDDIEWINVLYPKPPLVAVKGDGIIDDSAGLNALFEYAKINKKRVFIPPATFKCVTNVLIINCNVFGVGADSVLNGSVRIDEKGSLTGIQILSNAPTALLIRGTSLLRLQDIKIDNLTIEFESTTTVDFRHAILAEYVDRLVLKNSTIRYGVQFTSCSNFLMTENHIDGDNYQNHSELLHVTFRSSGIITDNTFTRTADNFIDLFSSGERVLISNNRFIGCKSKFGQGIEIKVSLSDTVTNTSSNANGWVESIIISNNVLREFYPYANGPFQAISIYYVDNRATKIFTWSETPRNILIEGNIIEKYDESDVSITSSYFIGIRLEKVWGVNIVNNIIRDIQNKTVGNLQTSAITLMDCKEIMITKNNLSVQDGSLINFYLNNTRINIEGNFGVLDELTGHKAKRGLYFVKSGATISTASKFNILNNEFDCTDFIIKASYLDSDLLTMDISHNKFYTGMSDLMSMGCSRFVDNDVDSATDGVWLGRDNGAVTSMNNVRGNRIKTPNTKVGFLINNLDKSILKDNIFEGVLHAFKMYGLTKNDIIKDNISVAQGHATIMLYYVNVTTADQATNKTSDNLIIA